MPQSNRFEPPISALFTDLYELTMAQAYYAEEMTEEAVFELFFREMPEERNYVVASGLDDILMYLEDLAFTDEDLEWLQASEQFSSAFLEKLQQFRFTGDVYAVREGTILFPNEPLVQVRAPLPEAQMVETFVLNQGHLQSVEASKAARVVTVADGRTVVDFGSRRAHGTDAAFKAARASYLAGAAGTSNVAAAKRFDIPAFGTMAHSYIEAHADEFSAFKAFAQEFPKTTLLVDTYDTLGGVRRVIELAELLGKNFQIRAIRLDSGDLLQLAKEARQQLDTAGLKDVKIFVSSGLDEHKLARLLEAGAPVDGFGVGTALAVSRDVPDIDFAYKLVAYADQPRMKLSSNKLTLPGPKQVFRFYDATHMVKDIIAEADENLKEGEPLLQPVMQSGKRLPAGSIALKDARAHAAAQLRALPPTLRALSPAKEPYPVEVSPALQRRTEDLRRQLEAEVT